MSQPPPPSEEGSLTAAQRAALAEAAERFKPIRRAMSVSTFTGWTVGAFGVITALIALTSLTTWAVGLALIAIAWNELQGRNLLGALDPAGAKRLGQNQLTLAGVVGLYCLNAIIQARLHPSPELVQLEELAGFEPGELTGLTVWGYASTLVVVTIFQVFMARFHYAREAIVSDYLRETPEWIADVRRSEGAG